MTQIPHFVTRDPAPYACSPDTSRGRLYLEPECGLRSVYQRDRDRIIHSSAFRRLTHKTQVFVYHEGDHYRTRLTHSLEVAQVARTLARILRLDEDLAEAISLAHDLGHTPFGHAGEEALSETMAFCGGFDHNAQSLHVVTRLESRYAAFEGLNLTWEALEGLVKHNGPVLSDDGTPTPRYAAKGVHALVTRYNACHDLHLSTFASVEAQIAALADDIAYNNHDLDDGLRAGLITVGKLKGQPLVGPFIKAVDEQYGAMRPSRLINEVNRRLISHMVQDLARATKQNLLDLGAQTADDVRHASAAVARFSEAMEHEMAELRAFLFQEFYLTDRVKTIMDGARKVVRDLYGYFYAHPDELPDRWRSDATGAELGRLIGDFVAGMTDRLAMDTHRRLFDDTPRLR